MLVTSSFTAHAGLLSIKRGDRRGLTRWLIVTLILGFTFLSLQIYDYAHLGFGLRDGDLRDALLHDDGVPLRPRARRGAVHVSADAAVAPGIFTPEDHTAVSRALSTGTSSTWSGSACSPPTTCCEDVRSGAMKVVSNLYIALGVFVLLAGIAGSGDTRSPARSTWSCSRVAFAYLAQESREYARDRRTKRATSPRPRDRRRGGRGAADVEAPAAPSPYHSSAPRLTPLLFAVGAGLILAGLVFTQWLVTAGRPDRAGRRGWFVETAAGAQQRRRRRPPTAAGPLTAPSELRLSLPVRSAACTDSPHWSSGARTLIAHPEPGHQQHARSRSAGRRSRPRTTVVPARTASAPSLPTPRPTSRNGSPSPSEYDEQQQHGARGAVPGRRPACTIAPSTGPMHGVQPTANAIPSGNAPAGRASPHPRPATAAPPGTARARPGRKRTGA